MIKYFPSLLLIVMGFMDCLTTVIGTLYFGTKELNPLIAGLVHSNLTAFVIIKIGVTVAAGLIFILAEKKMMGNSRKSKSFFIAHNMLRIAYGTVVIFLVIVVINNILVLARTI